MPVTDPKTLRDGQVSFIGGMDTSRDPSLIGSERLAYAENITVRGGFPQTRPPFYKLGLIFDDDVVEDHFKTGRFQGGEILGGRGIVATGGRLFEIDLENLRCKEVTPTGSIETVNEFISPPVGSSVTADVAGGNVIPIGTDLMVGGGWYEVTGVTETSVTMTNVSAIPGVLISTGTTMHYRDMNNPNSPQVWMVEAEGWIVVQNGRNRAILYDPEKGTWRRSTAGTSAETMVSKEVPTGTVMAYGLGRLWVATRGTQFVAGDIARGPTSVINFTETQYLNGGGAFTAPSNSERITGMVFIPTLDAALGQGPLLVFTPEEVYTVNAPFNREEWLNIANPIQTVALKPFGSESAWSVATVNGDVFYRSRDGIRSLTLARRDFGQWGNTPVSAELTRLIGGDDEPLMRYSSAILFDNRLLMTVTPKPNDVFGASHGCLAVLDFNVVSAMGSRLPPAWDGFWTGFNFLKLAAGNVADKYRAFFFNVNSDGENEMWEISKQGEKAFDNGDRKIMSALETKAVAFGSPFMEKRLRGLELWYDKLSGDIDWTAKWRPDQYPCWFTWRTWNDCQKYRSCSEDTEGACNPFQIYNVGYRTRKAMGEPPGNCATSDNMRAEIGYEFQIRLEWTGMARLRKYLAVAVDTDSSPIGRTV